ncbi:MAG: hypothetical protein AMJ46_00165 [Latescibacteria bacterium DG_63]|nr:MAG: hypothetical protein AMJ46_00165 [Latescibacteria bacterium DG_63]
MPFVPVTPPPPPSPRAQELGRRLREVIDNFRREHPDMTGTEISQAMGLAMRGAGSRRQALLIGVVLALLALGFLAFFLFRRQSGEEGQTVILPIIVVLAMVFAGAAAFLKNR